MGTVILLLLLLWAVLAVLLAGWSLWFQGYIYTEPSPGLLWRGPVAATAVMVVVVLWVFLDYRSPGSYRTLVEFSSGEDTTTFPELRVPGPRGEEVYKLRPGSRTDYVNKDRQPLPSRPSEVIVEEGGQKYIFKPDLDEKGKFKQRTTSSWLGQGKEPLRYTDEKGRVMLEGELGQLTRSRGGVFVVGALLHILLFVAWWLVLWLLLRFQWAHALGQAVVFWLVLLLLVQPYILKRAEDAAPAQAAQKP